MNELADSLFNRRSDPRIPCFQKAHYVDLRGQKRRTEILNTSQGGAKITVDKGVRIGDRFRLLDQEQNDSANGTAVEVRWIEPLPGGVRLIVGVKKLESLAAPL
ncbi:MAG TPA: PilZ domain-containing protein [Phycisphaerales bacterium]|nr:PilZ domain-containing protein [Phycisphaerales bacterium]